VRIDRSDPADEPGDAHIAGRARSAPDDPGAAGKDRGTAVSGDGPPDSSPARPDSALRTERTAAYRAVVDAVYRQYTTDHGYALVEGLERETGTPTMRRIEAEDRLKGKGRPAEAADTKKGEAPQAADDTTAVAWDGSAAADHDGWVWDHGGDVPDDPRNYSNPKTGRFDSSWSTEATVRAPAFQKYLAGTVSSPWHRRWPATAVTPHAGLRSTAGFGGDRVPDSARP
jgi:hypothetical protein